MMKTLKKHFCRNKQGQKKEDNKTKSQIGQTNRK